MATRTKRVQIAAPPADDVQDVDEMTREPWQLPAGAQLMVQEADDEPPEETPAERVLGLLRDAGSDATTKLELYRLPGNGRKLTWVDTMTPEDYERGGLKFISEKWGAGDYEIRLYGTTNGRTGVMARVQVTIEAPRISPVLAGAGGSELARVLETMAAQQNQMLQALTNRPEPVTVDPMVQMRNMLEMMTLMRTATAGPVEKKSSIAEMVDAIKELKGVSSLLGEGDGDNPMSMLKDLLPVIQAGLQAKANQPQPAPPPMLPAPPVSVPPEWARNPAAKTPTPDAPRNGDQPPQIEVPNMNPLQIIKLQSNLAALLAMAAQNIAVEDAAEYVADELPDEMINVLAEDEWWSMLSAMESRVAPYQEWFTKVRDAALALFDDPGNDDAEAGTDANPSTPPAAAPAGPADNSGGGG